jgi:hypothetical protein
MQFRSLLAACQVESTSSPDAGSCRGGEAAVRRRPAADAPIFRRFTDPVSFYNPLF